MLVGCAISLRAQTWVIDAGHGGHDGGCEGQHSCEKTINLRVAKEVARLVRANMGEVKVVMTRDDDYFVSLENRCRIANSARADLFVSIHVNAAPDNNTVRGTETYFGPLGGTTNASLEDARRKNIAKSELLARLVQRHYSQIGRPSMRGVKQERYWVILHTMMPSILTEVGFISTPSEEELLNSEEGIKQISRSIFDALADYQKALRTNTVSSALAELRRRPLAPSTNTDLASNGVSITPTTPVSSTAVAPVKTNAPVPAAKKDTAKTIAPSSKVDSPSPSSNVSKTSPTPAVVAKNTPKSDTKTEASKTNDKSSSNTTQIGGVKKGIEFCVQLCSVRNAIKENDPRFNGLSPIRVVHIGDVYKCYYGSTNDYLVAVKLKQEVAQRFEGAFLVAFKDGSPISVADAKEMYKDYMNAK